MEPRSCDRGKLDGRVLGRFQCLLQWSRDHVIAERGIFEPSMAYGLWLQWSRDHVIAERAAGITNHNTGSELQWSRDHVIAERAATEGLPAPFIGFNGAAIM